MSNLAITAASALALLVFYGYYHYRLWRYAQHRFRCDRAAVRLVRQLIARYGPLALDYLYADDQCLRLVIVPLPPGRGTPQEIWDELDGVPYVVLIRTRLTHCAGRQEVDHAP